MTARSSSRCVIDIIIRYDPALGHEEAALALARRLFARLDERIDSLALIPDDASEFDLYLNGRLVHSLSRSGRAPLAADVTAALAKPSSGQSS
jgi:predicted Rdx family selenoprotein